VPWGNPGSPGRLGWFQLGRFRRKELRLLLLAFLLLPPVVLDQMAKGDFEKVAKPAALGIEAFEIAAQ